MPLSNQEYKYVQVNCQGSLRRYWGGNGRGKENLLKNSTQERKTNKAVLLFKLLFIYLFLIAKSGTKCLQCHNGCCRGNSHCLNGGTCQETCDRRRFRCACRPGYIGTYCDKKAQGKNGGMKLVANRFDILPRHERARS